MRHLIARAFAWLLGRGCDLCGAMTLHECPMCDRATCDECTAEHGGACSCFSDF